MTSRLDILGNNLVFKDINLLFFLTGILLTILTAFSAHNYILIKRKTYYIINIFYILGFSLVILTDNWFMFLMGWEMVTLTTTLMLLWSNKRLAKQYFIIQFFGSSFLIYVILIAINNGYNLVSKIDIIWLQNMFIFGLGMKSAIFFLHFWLPPIHSQAPSPVSAVLSGWVVKLGFITYIKIIPSGNNLLLILGFLMVLYGGIKALLASDYKVLLAYSSISQLGYIALGIGGGIRYAYLGSIIHIIAHGLAKTTLFIGSGYWIKEYGSRSIYDFKNVLKRQKILGLSTIICFFSLMGFPFLPGFYSKYLIKYNFKGDTYLNLLFYLGTLLTIMYSFRFLWLGVFNDIFQKNNISKKSSLNFSEVFSLVSGIILILLIGIHPDFLLNFYPGEVVTFHLITGLKEFILYFIIAVSILIIFKWFKVDSKEPPSLDRLFIKWYRIFYSLSSRTWKYDSGVFFENYLYRFIFTSSRYFYNIVYTNFQNQLLWIPVIFVGILLWLAILNYQI